MRLPNIFSSVGACRQRKTVNYKRDQPGVIFHLSFALNFLTASTH